MHVVLPSCGMKSRGRLLLIRRDMSRCICGSGRPERRHLLAQGAVAGSQATEAGTSYLHDILFRERDRHVRLLGCDVDLSFAGFELLRLLAERHPEVVSKREIAERLGIRPMANYASSARSYIGYLRSDLKLAGLAHVVVNERWVGYRLDLQPLP